MAIDPRFLAQNAREVFTGNELLVKGCLEVEGGVQLLTGYPGSPVAGFFDGLGDIKSLLKDKGMRAFQANNEALAAASLNGSQMLPIRAIAAMKNVGVHVAADALALANLAGAHPQGGAVIISGEDPWCESTQVPADSRFIFEHLRMPVVEPGSIQQVKDWIDACFKLSQAAGLYIGYIITNAHADGGGSVWCRPNQYPELNTKVPVELDTAKIDLDRVLLPPRTWQHELQVSERFAKTIARARELRVNRIIGGDEGDAIAPLGFIVAGNASVYLSHILNDLGLAGVFPILQMGMTYPVDTGIVREFSRVCGTMVVVEERRSFLEKNIRDAVFHELPAGEAADINARLFGKKFPGGGDGIPDTRGLNYSVLAQRIIPLIKSIEQIPAELRNGRLTAELVRLREASRPKLNVIKDNLVPRTATFCPGCPHRDSSAVLLEIRKCFADVAYMKKRHNRGPVDLLSHGDTGCYTMLMFAPTSELMHNYSGMGLGAGTGSGIAPFISNKQLVFMGDGTFFHSGQIAITNAVKAGQDITFIILENGTTAMTGHQDHAGVAEDDFGNVHARQDIERIVRGMAASAPIQVAKLSPEKREKYKEVLEGMILADGVKVVIADKECGITFNRTRQREERQIVKKVGFLPRKTHMNITPEVCENCLECTKQTACPGLTTIDTDYGRKIDTDLTWCVNDGACERVRVSNEFGESIKACPSFEQVTIKRSRRRRYLLPHMSLDRLPEPKHAHDMSEPGATWRCHMSGVGGMGIGMVSAILVRAAHKEGYEVVFQDKKGLAIRNGGVFSQITFVRGGEARRHEGTEASSLPTAYCPLPASSGSIPYGKADLLLGIDILEAARAVDARQDFRVASAQRTAAVLNMYRQPTVNVLLGTQEFDVEALREDIYSHCQADASYAANLSELCERRLGSKQFVNIMMLGVAYQLGLIPVNAHAIAWAIKDTIRREHRRNLKAFNIGRKLALEPRVLPPRPEPETWEQLVTNKIRILRKTRLFGSKWAAAYERLVNSAMRQMRLINDDLKYDLALRIYDILQYEDHRLAKRYIDLVRSVYKRDSAAHNFAATAAAIWNIAKVILIKDEPYVAYLLTRFEKKQRDVAKFNVDQANGDKLVYRHHTKPEIVIGPWRFRLNITTTDWMLKLAANCKWLRKLPGWHERETGFREWYIGLLDRVDLSSEEAYAASLTALKCPEQISGYREIRYPKLIAAKEMAEGALRPRAEAAPEREAVTV